MSKEAKISISELQNIHWEKIFPKATAAFLQEEKARN